MKERICQVSSESPNTVRVNRICKFNPEILRLFSGQNKFLGLSGSAWKMQSSERYQNYCTVGAIILAPFEALHLLKCPSNVWHQTVFSTTICGWQLFYFLQNFKKIIIWFPNHSKLNQCVRAMYLWLLFGKQKKIEKNVFILKTYFSRRKVPWDALKTYKALQSFVLWIVTIQK